MKKYAKKFKKGDRVYHAEMGYGTVVGDSYNTIHFTNWTCVKYDVDFLGEKLPLCGDTDELTLVEK